MDAWALLIQPPKKVHLVIRSNIHGCMAPAHTTTKKVHLVLEVIYMDAWPLLIQPAKGYIYSVAITIKIHECMGPARTTTQKGTSSCKK